MLTQPSWLVAHSGNFDNDPVLRGKWIREKLLAGYVMDVPINVDAQVPDDEHRTLRQRFEVVRAEQCWRCHIKMNPLGMPFESYNHVGRYRDLELGRPVDASGEINFTGAPGLDGKVGGAREMMERIAGSDLARQSLPPPRLPLLDGPQRDAQRFQDADRHGQSLPRKRRQFQRTPRRTAHLRLLPLRK